MLDTQYWRDISVEPVFFFFACLLDRERFTMQWEARFACVWQSGQPFTEPTVNPFTKYFCRKGYRMMMGRVEVMMTADLMEMAMVVLSALPAASPSMDVPLTMLRRNSITGNWDVFR